MRDRSVEEWTPTGRPPSHTEPPRRPSTSVAWPPKLPRRIQVALAPCAMHAVSVALRGLRMVHLRRLLREGHKAVGHPRRVKPRRAMGMSERRVDWEASASGGMNNKDLLWFTCSPRAGPSSSTMRRATARSSGEPTKVPSSIYQALRERPGTSALIFSMNGWRVRANPKGPKGSPC